MGSFGDGGIFATKPYVSSGRYIQRMGPTLCAACRYDPKRTDGEEACPFNHLYWDFLDRHRPGFEKNPRMSIPLASLRRLSKAVMDDHHLHARAWRETAVGSARRRMKS